MLNFTGRRPTPLILQTEAAECGLACVAMVASHHGHRVDLASMRHRHGLSLKGATLASIMQIGRQMALAPRALRLELGHLAQLKLPCILHWDFNHFVVLVQVNATTAVIHDPARGRQVVVLKDEFSRRFTGVALELAPTESFEQKTERRRTRVATLLGRPQGLGSALAHIVVLALVLQVFALTSPFYMQWVVDQALVSLDRDFLSVLALGFLLIAVLQAGVTALRTRLLMVMSTRLNLQVLSNLFRHLIRLPMNWFDSRHVGDVMSRFDSLNVVQRTLTTSFVEALIDGVMALATLAMMLVYSVQLALIAVVAAALYGAIRFALYRPMRRATEEQIVRQARQQSHFLESVRGIQSIKLFAQEDTRTGAWQNLAVEHFNASVRVQRLQGLHQFLNSLLFGIENVATIWWGARLVLDPAGGSGFSVGMLFAFVSYKTQFVQRVSALIEKGIEVSMLGLHVERVGDIASTAAERSIPDASPFMAVPPAKGGAALRLDGVAFRYSASDTPVLTGIDLEIEAGESVAIVGASGCGKTTLVKLMLGLLQPTAGRISIGGETLASIGLARYRGMVASVMQDDQLFAGSIAENISFFDPEPDHALIATAAHLASVHDDIDAFPMKFNTLVGDMGTVLSGGQKQRILLARALYRRPRILILDEATSHLDVARERSVNEAIRSLPLTRIIVAHRPETIASADRVVAMTAGRLVTVRQPVREGMKEAA